jgi:NADH-quinone oxidoreductase subunit H
MKYFNIIYDFTGMNEAIHTFLSSVFNPTLTYLIEALIIIIVMILFIALLGLSLVLAERKVAAYFQQRLGPLRVGYWGSMQTVADITKLILKENLRTGNADKFLFNLAPYVIMMSVIMAMGVIPYARGLQIYDIDIGVFFVTAVSSIGVISILLAGWASNNKYSLIAAIRSGAQVLSYELSVGLSILTIVIMTESLQFSEIVASQEAGWWIWRAHVPAIIAFVIFMIAGTAETNRGPFDLPEAESELTAGFHTEYSGIKFAYFFLAEFLNMFIIAAVGTTVFLGGWMPFHIGGLEGFNAVMDFIPPVIWFVGKATFIIFLMMWFRWTFPRLRMNGSICCRSIW